MSNESSSLFSSLFLLPSLSPQGSQRSANRLAALGALGCLFVSSHEASAFFIDGNGHFGARGETRTAPEFQNDQGTYQATELSFDLNGEIRANDRTSFHLRLGIFEDENKAYLGDKAEPGQCSKRRNSDGTTSSSCEGRHQSTTDTGYKKYSPEILEAYAKYSFSHCILTAGRRSRDLGLGLLYSSAKNPFEKKASVFDGVTCDINAQKQQDIGFYFGFDKLQETGTYVDNPYDKPVSDQNQEAAYNRRESEFGANRDSDDLDQIFVGIMLDDLKSKGPGATFAKQVGIYFANILGDESNTDVKYFDLFTGIYTGNLAFKNEAVFRMGKTSDPSIVSIGGKRDDEDGPAKNNVQSIGIAGEIEYTWSRSGASLGPSEFNEGNASRHASYFLYAYAPGDANGYYEDAAGMTADQLSSVGESKRDNKAKAMAFHRNYKPAMLFFNGKPMARSLNRPGVYSSDRVMNASLFALGYKYEHQENGTFDMRLITARLLEGPPQEVKSYYADKKVRPIGYEGLDLGYELDLMYNWRYRQEVELGTGIAAGLPGKAWDVSTDGKRASLQLGLQGSFAIKF